MGKRREWAVVNDDREFASLFEGARILRAQTDEPRDGIGADLYWLLSDGTWLAMEVSAGVGCDTCGYGAGEKTYWVRRPDGCPASTAETTGATEPSGERGTP